MVYMGNKAGKQQIRDSRNGYLECPFTISYAGMQGRSKPSSNIQSSTPYQRTANDPSEVLDRAPRSGVGCESLTNKARVQQEQAIREVFGGTLDVIESGNAAATGAAEPPASCTKQQRELERALQFRKGHVPPSDRNAKRARSEEEVPLAESTASVEHQQQMTQRQPAATARVLTGARRLDEQRLAVFGKQKQKKKNCSS